MRLAVEDLNVSFDGRPALDGVDLQVAPGEVLAVLGPSGCGKTTLLRAVAGLQPLRAGRVLVDGRDVTGVAPHRRGVGLMFQDHALFPHRDVGANVAFGLRMQGRPADEVRRRVDHLLDLVGLPGAARRSVRTLSGGEQQRVALARALAPEPRVLLLDEPFGALDRVLRDRLLDEVRALVTRLGLTVVAVTHDQLEAFALADRLAVMDAGAVLATGTPAGIWQRPADVRVARFLGFANVATAEVRGPTLHTPWGEVSAGEVRPGRHWVLVRESAVTLAAPGAARGPSAEVASASFRGDHVRLVLDLGDGPPLHADVGVAGAPRPGDDVEVVIDPAGVEVLDSTSVEPDE